MTIEPLRGADDARAFRQLNLAWIERLFTVEDEDRRTLDDPQGTIVAPGGDVLIARDEAGAAVGCVALIPAAGTRCELAKMAVAPEARGRGIGRALLRAALRRAAERGWTEVFLGSSTKLPEALRLYESEGFRRVAAQELDLPYVRADVFMVKSLS